MIALTLHTSVRVTGINGGAGMSQCSGKPYIRVAGVCIIPPWCEPVCLNIHGVGGSISQLTTDPF